MTHPSGPEESDDSSSEGSDIGAGQAGTLGLGGRTPLYRASNSPRYQRQDIIKRIQGRTERHLICYVSGSGGRIDWDDTVPFVDLLYNIPVGSCVDLLLHTLGGNLDAAEKLVRLVRRQVGKKDFRIIVPDMAKSAGTLMVLGADSVVMSVASELGPIDPQVELADGNGLIRPHSVQHYLDAYEEHYNALKEHPNDVAARVLLSKIDPATVKLFQAIMARARQSAEQLLKIGMYRDGGPWTITSEALLDTERWLSHSQMISWEDARDPNVGLVVDYLDQESELWQDYWELYCLQRLAITETQKLFESNHVSLPI